MQGNTNQEQKTTPKQDLFIQAMLAGNNIVTSAQIAGCNEKTAHVWLKLPHVQTAYRTAQRSLFDESLSHLMTDVEDACSTLKTIMKDNEVSASVRVRAAQIILEKSIEIHKMSALEQKIAELEEMIGQRS